MAAGVGVAALLVVAATWSGAPVSAPGPPAPIVTDQWVNATATEGGLAGVHAARDFFAVVFTAAADSTVRLQAAGQFFNTTPIGWYRYGGGGTSYDPVTGTNFVPPPAGGKYVGETNALWNLTWFKSWCNARPAGCQWLAFLPGEVNDTAFAVETAAWFHTVLGFAPTLWQFGNEPAGWTHYGLNYSSWSTADASVPTAAAYASMAANYAAAVRTLYPTDAFVGLESGCGCDYRFASAVASALGTRAAGEAYHAFPSAPHDDTDPAAFLGTLNGSTNLVNEASAFRGGLTAGCPGCGAVPVQLGAYQIGDALHNPFVLAFPGAVFLGASVIQALLANVSMFTIFNSDSLFNTTSGTIEPQGVLVQRILANLTMGNDFPVVVNASGVGGIYALATANGPHRSLFLVNANTTTGIRFAVPPTIVPNGTVGSIWTWNDTTTYPVATTDGPIAPTYDVPAASILLLTWP